MAEGLLGHQSGSSWHFPTSRTVDSNGPLHPPSPMLPRGSERGRPHAPHSQPEPDGFSDCVYLSDASTAENLFLAGLSPGGSAMGKPRMTYFEKEDILHVSVSDDHEASSVELTPNITAELNERGELIGIEILQASSCVRDSILESVQAKQLRLSESGTQMGSS
jgi:uncharacterized protein YuzE